jgi:hypothetical protein
MKRHALIVLYVSFFFLNTQAKSSFTMQYNGKKYTVQELSSSIGQLNNRTFVKLVCIKPGMIGMPNIADPAYRGKYVNDRGETCYTFVLEPDGTLFKEDQAILVYRIGNEGFLVDGTKVRIECLKPGEVATTEIAPGYYGTYFKEDLSGDISKRQQCRVYLQNIRKPMPYIAGIGTGFR